MTDTNCRARAKGSEQRGIALIIVLLALVLLLILGMAVSFGTTSEIRASRSYERQAQALLIAEAGGAHALDLIRNMTVVTPSGFDPVLLGPDGLPNTADDGCLCDAGRVGGPIFNGVNAIPLQAPGFALPPGNYIARAYDDDNMMDLDGDGRPDLGLTPPPNENGDPFDDANGKIVVRVTGRGEARSEAVVDFIIARRALPALLVNGEAELEDNAQLLGEFGSVHSNCTPPPGFDPGETGVELEGPVMVSQDATSSCQIEADPEATVLGITAASQPQIPIPPLLLPQPFPEPPYGPNDVNLPALADIILVGDEDDLDLTDGDRDEAANILRAAGITPAMLSTATATSGTPLDLDQPFVVVRTADAQSRLPAGACPALPCYIQPLPEIGGGGSAGAGDNTFGWVIQDDDFNLLNPGLSNGMTVFGVGEDFELQNNIGQPTPIQLTILASEEIEIEANVNLIPDLVLNQPPFNGTPLLMWSPEEVEIEDGGTLNASGLIYVGEEFECEDSSSVLNGQVMVFGEMNEDDEGDAPGDGEAELKGGCTIRLDNPLLAMGNWRFGGWRLIKR